MPIVVNINSGADYEPVSEGVHAAVLADIEDLGVVQTSFGPKEKVRFTWLTDEADENGRTKYLFKRYTKSLHEKASLRKDVEKILGKPLGDVKAFDVESLIGSQNALIVEHSEGTDGKVYANVSSILKPKGAKVEIPSDFQRKKDRPATAGTPGNRSVQAVGGGKAVAAAVLSKPKYEPITDSDIPF